MASWQLSCRKWCLPGAGNSACGVSVSFSAWTAPAALAKECVLGWAAALQAVLQPEEEERVAALSGWLGQRGFGRAL